MKNLVYMSAKGDINFITSNLFYSIVKSKNILFLNFLFKNYLYDNQTILLFLNKYKYKYKISNEDRNDIFYDIYKNFAYIN